MYFSSLAFTCLSLVAGLASAAPTVAKRSESGLNIVYWGQNGGGTVENNDLSTYCASSAGIDVIVLAFLYEYGEGNDVASGTIGQSCYISPQGEPQQCDDLAAAVATCQANGVKVIMSLGGASGAYSLQSQSDAQTIGQNLWDAWGNSPNGSVPRPFGSTFVNGWDFDIESNSGNQYYQYMISTLRSNFASDPSNTYWITGAPQCPIPGQQPFPPSLSTGCFTSNSSCSGGKANISSEPNMGEIITSAQFDYLWVQFYNNPGCSTNGGMNYDDWKTYIANTPSANAKLAIGVPAAPDASTGTASGAQYYLAPADLASLVGQYSSDAAFGGIMMWSAGFSDSNVNDGCTYAQEAKSILTTGAPCS